jgi:hypothetical protein
MSIHNIADFDDREILAFYAENKKLNVPLISPKLGWVIFAKTSLDSQSAWDYFNFRYMGQFNISDMYLLGTDRHQEFIYGILVTPCQQ